MQQASQARQPVLEYLGAQGAQEQFSLYLVMYGPTVFKISLKSDIWFTVARLMLRQQLHDQCEDVRIIQT